MHTLNPRQSWLLALFLALLLLATRGHHFASAKHLPGASTAIFFIAGVYLPRVIFPVLFCCLAVFSDWFAITKLGVSDFCITPAYTMLLPAYAALFLGGRWYRKHHQDKIATLLPLGGALFVSTLVSHLCSSGGFYFLGGRFADPTLLGFWPRFTLYFPQSLSAIAFYVGIAALLHSAHHASLRLTKSTI